MLNNNLYPVSAESAEALRIKLLSIKCPYGISAIYHDGKNHVAWIRTDRPLLVREIKRLGE
jgi:hypothetical protein